MGPPPQSLGKGDTTREMNVPICERFEVFSWSLIYCEKTVWKMDERIAEVAEETLHEFRAHARRHTTLAPLSHLHR